MTPDSAVTHDRILDGRLVVAQPVRGHRVGHDAILLASAAPDDTRHLVDFGAGVGAAGLAALHRLPVAKGCLVEIDPVLADLARRNIEQNGFAGRCESVIGDIARLARPDGPPGFSAAFDLVLSNPPFNCAMAHQASPHAARARAHMAGRGQLEDWILAAYRCLEPAGRLVMILRPQDLQTLLEAFTGRFGAAELIPVHPAPHKDAVRLIVRARKGRRTAPMLRPGLILASVEGVPTPQAEAVLRGGQALSFT